MNLIIKETKDGMIKEVINFNNVTNIYVTDGCKKEYNGEIMYDVCAVTTAKTLISLVSFKDKQMCLATLTDIVKTIQCDDTYIHIVSE